MTNFTLLTRIEIYTIAYKFYKKSKNINESKKMSIKYKIIKRGQPGVVGGGDKKHYASANITGEASINDLTRYIEKISTVSGTDIRAVLYALVDVAADELAEGKIVRLGDLGSLRISINSNGYDNPAYINESAIKGTKVIFSPGNKLKEMQKTLTYTKTV